MENVLPRRIEAESLLHFYNYKTLKNRITPINITSIVACLTTQEMNEHEPIRGEFGTFIHSRSAPARMSSSVICMSFEQITR